MVESQTQRIGGAEAASSGSFVVSGFVTFVASPAQRAFVTVGSETAGFIRTFCGIR